MDKKLFLAVCASVAFASCTNDAFFGENAAEKETLAINFAGESANFTRASSGATAAALLNNEFKVLGVLNNGGSKENVFQNYVVKYDGLIGNDDSNEYGWSYLTTDGQYIKYWNLTATRYEFVAFSGIGSKDIANTESNSIQGVDASNVANIFASDKVVATYSGTYRDANNEVVNCVKYGRKVPFNFKRLGAQVRLGVYETVPGYAVKNVKFYYGDNVLTANINKASETVGLSGDFAVSGDYVVTYDAANVAVANLTSGGTHTNQMELGTLNYDADGAISTTPALPTWATIGGEAWQAILPYASNTKNLVFRVDYDLVPLDGGATIRVYNASAVIPYSWAQWKPNYAYTYVFKISNQTSGQTTRPDIDPEKDTDGDGIPDIYDDDDDGDGIPDVDDPDDDGDGIDDEDETPDPGYEIVPDPDTENPDPTRPAVSPIVFDAVVSDILDYNQETITGVTALGGNAITTYSATSNYTDAAEYGVGEDIVLSSPSRGQWRLAFSDVEISEADVASLTLNFDNVIGGATADGQTIHQASEYGATFKVEQEGYYIVWLRYLPNTYWNDPADDVPANYVDVYKVIKAHN